MAGSFSRNKGQRFEREVLKAFQDKFGGEWRRTQGGESQEFLGDVRPLGWDSFPFCIECKVSSHAFLEQTMEGVGPIWDWWVQAVHQTPKGKLPLLVCRSDRHPAYAVVDDDGLVSINGHEWVPVPRMEAAQEGDKTIVHLMKLDVFLELFRETADCCLAA